MSDIASTQGLPPLAAFGTTRGAVDRATSSDNADKMVLPSREEAVRAARQFEAIFVQMLVKDMRENDKAFGEGLFGDGVGSDIHEGLFDTMLSDRLAESGRIGFADHIVRNWEQRGRVAKADEPVAKDPIRSLNRIRAIERDPIQSMTVKPSITSLPPEPELLPAAHAIKTIPLPDSPAARATAQEQHDDTTQ
ncbi:MAG: rod-binding protein [Planctomycetes bacterium]|nr:rod-binding protein [Planctomycetota bacterium]